MKAQLYAHLVTAIETWFEDHAAEGEDAYYCGEIEELMATAAASVYDAVAKSQRAAVEDEMLLEPQP